MKQFFHDYGYFVSLSIFTSEECQELRESTLPKKLNPWKKAHATTNPTIARYGAHPFVLDVLNQLLGENIILYGAHIRYRNPGKPHPWHCDIDAYGIKGPTVTVWIGIENTTPKSSLRVITKSDFIGISVQQHSSEQNLSRDEITSNIALRWAQKYQPGAEIQSIGATNGDAIFFDGKLWHGSHNTQDVRRGALILQYTCPEYVVYIPRFQNFNWPFKYTSIKAPALLVSGIDTVHVNKIVPTPGVEYHDDDD